MKVLLKEDVDNLGYAGEVYKVADGYGRNYLIPRGLAVIATRGVMNQADAWRRKAEARREEMRAEYEALSIRINETTLNYIARAGDSGKLYGSITTSQITDDLNELLGTDIDRRKVGVEPLRQLGEHQVIVRLNADFQPEVTVVVESEDGTPAIVEVDEAQIIIEEDGEVVEIDETVIVFDDGEELVEETIIEELVADLEDEAGEIEELEELE